MGGLTDALVSNKMYFLFEISNFIILKFMKFLTTVYLATQAKKVDTKDGKARTIFMLFDTKIALVIYP